MNYEQAFKDHEFLWDIAPACDMTGAYVDQEDLERLLKSPTKATARDCLCHQIEYWFEAGPDSDLSNTSATSFSELVEKYPEIQNIMDRHYIDSAEFSYSALTGS